MRPTSITAIGAADGDIVAMAGGNYRIVISGAQTGGEFAAIEMLVPPNNGPGPHAHKDIDESFYVLEGEVVFKSETQTYTATKGAYINIPFGGAVHCFKNESNANARLLCLVRPAGLEEMFKTLGKPVAAGVFLPPPPMDEATMKNMKEVVEQYGQELFPPDYLDKK